MNKLCRDYKKLVVKGFKDYSPTIILYGSNIYNAASSDLDVCVIFNNNITDKTRESLIKKTIDFQRSRNLRIDEEIPFENKLIFTIREVHDIFANSPFRDENNNYKIDKIQKTKEFLSSYQMKQRLLINILTTDHKIATKNIKYIHHFEQRAWLEIIDVITNLFDGDIKDTKKFVKLMYTNQATGDNGEMFLGYK